ncbi:hypothetical protein [Nitrosomonas mobilis]|uniref:Uncharacterized protein n=1 Tax=Nitrosomonas mobilis TaxID=51642 RepID=A0A1G5SC88_9PROT|nr:hypothetical protein [Nitrosomonas mobilis]SCZ84762.1 conserved exported hypothetical protein [Nitrosomonas mobilis]
MFLFKGFANSLRKVLLMSLCFMVLGIGNTLTAAAASNVSVIESAVTAFKTIGTLRKEFPINGDAIAAEYAGALQTLTQEVDTANSLTLDSDVLAAIDDIKNDYAPRLAAQVIDKTLQRVFYQSIWNRIAAIRDQFETGTSDVLTAMLDESVAAFQAISGTVARENQILTADRQALEAGSNPGLDAEVNDHFSRVRTALNKSNPEEDFITVQIARYGIRMSLTRAYYIGVLREVAGVIEQRGFDPDETSVLQKEGEIFYRTIESLVARGNPAGSLRIKAQLTGDPSKVVADEIVSELGKGFIGRVVGEMNGQARAITEKDRPHAVAEAAGAKYYARILLPDLEVRLGAADRSNLENELENLLTASNELSASKSEQARDAISAILTEYENTLNRANYEITQHTAIVENALANYQAIDALRNQAPIDADAIAAKYAGDLQQLTQLVDQIYGQTVDQNVSAAIAQIKAGDQVALALQVIDKSLQKTFALVVYDRATLALAQFDNFTTDELTLEWDRAYTAYSAIAKTANKEDKVLSADKQSIVSGSDPDLDYQITAAFALGKRALDKTDTGDALSLALARENIVIPLARSFLVGVLREVEGIIENRTDEVDEAREKQIEGEYFYRIVENFIAQDNPSGSSQIKAQLTGDLSSVVADQIVSEISRGILGQIRRSIQQIEVNYINDKNQALLALERLSLYSGIFSSDLSQRLSVSKRSNLENAIRDLKDAINTGNADRAVALRSILTAIIVEYESSLL